ncbi:outer membrane lipoprotein carrier protein LolA [Collimonas fungivorans]|uniref:outer membrane lipoprotein carrier protein LolA n=1 Tax=Collimonas fungivorans TaxID=158899 RepID=UPI003FA37BC4
MKRNLIAVLATVFLSCGAWPALAAAPVEKIQAMLARPPVLCGRFDQSKQLVGIKKPLLSNGRFCVVNGKGVLWRTLQPFPNTLRLKRDEIVQMQGDRVAMRMDAKQEPVVRMINSVLFSLLAGDLSQLDSLFELDGSVQGNSWKVALKARQPALAKAIGTLALSGGAYVKTVTISEASGDRTDISFSELQSGSNAMTAEEGAAFD